MRAMILRSGPGSDALTVPSVMIEFTAWIPLLRAPARLQVELPELLAQSVAVQAEQLGRPDLVAPGRLQRERQQRPFHLAQDTVVESARRQAMRMRLEVTVEMALDRLRERLLAAIGARGR
jgi:hypothetical protein